MAREVFSSLDAKVVKPEGRMAFKSAEIVSISATEVGMFQDDSSNGGPVRNKGRVEADTEIEVADRSRLGKERELVAATAWLGGSDPGAALDAAQVAYKPGWDQFAVNEALMGTQSNYSDVSAAPSGQRPAAASRAPGSRAVGPTPRTPPLVLHKILLYFEAFVHESTILSFPPPHLHCLPWCNSIALLRNILRPADPSFVCHTPYNIGNGNVV